MFKRGKSLRIGATKVKQKKRNPSGILKSTQDILQVSGKYITITKYIPCNVK